MLRIGRTLSTETKACFKLEQQLAAILSYITDQRMMHYSYKERRTYTNDINANTHIILDNLHTKSIYTQLDSKDKYENVTYQTMIKQKSRQYQRDEYKNSEYHDIKNCKNNKTKKENIDTICVPDFSIPYITKDMAETIIKKYTESYIVESAKIDNNTKNKCTRNIKQETLEKAYYSSLCIHDLYDDPSTDMIQMLNINMNDILFMDKTITLDNNETETVKILRLLQDTYYIIPPYMADDYKIIDEIPYAPYYTNYERTVHNATNNTTRWHVQNYDNEHIHVQNKLEDMLQIINMIQEQMSTIKDPGFHNFLVKSGMIDEPLIKEPKEKKSTKTAKSKTEVNIIDADVIKIIDAEEISICK
jgi:hypothetical protein